MTNLGIFGCGILGSELKMMPGVGGSLDDSD